VDCSKRLIDANTAATKRLRFSHERLLRMTLFDFTVEGAPQACRGFSKQPGADPMKWKGSS
jgi:hypothetical protein